MTDPTAHSEEHHSGTAAMPAAAWGQGNPCGSSGGAAEAGLGTVGASALLLSGRAERSSGGFMVFKVKTSNQGK